ncbi:MAG: hypothetical protein QXD13_00185, partial [Candidatus Pacearchaeota archaeon]
MVNEEILKTIREKGLLLEKEIFDLVNSFKNVDAARDFLSKLEASSGQKMITKAVLNKNFEYVQNIFNKLQGEDKSSVENVIVKLGLSLEISKEKTMVDKKAEINKNTYQIISPDSTTTKKIEVNDFVESFRSRYLQMQRILMARPNLQNLVSINKISNNRQSLSIIGMVSEKRVTKNKNLMVRFEDLTGEISGLVKFENEEVFKKADELQLDDVVGIRASGNRDFLYIHDIIYPDAFLPQRIKFEEDISIAFLSDVHAGSKMHLGKNFERFIEWLNSEDENAKKIKYLFFVGDNVDGVGIFPGQEDVLMLKSMKEQYALLASYLRKVPKQIT